MDKRTDNCHWRRRMLGDHDSPLEPLAQVRLKRMLISLKISTTLGKHFLHFIQHDHKVVKQHFKINTV